MTNRLVLITGNHPRHRYVVESLAQIGADILWIREIREAHVPTTPSGLSTQLRQLYDLHFQGRSRAESDFFDQKNEILTSIKKVDVELKDLNSIKTTELIKSWAPKVVISYGCNKLEEEILDCCEALFINIHGGLSPWYRGTITHFWPTYLLEPQFTGVTVHETTTEIDGGRIYFQSSINLDINDGIHENACRTITQFCQTFIPLLDRNWENLQSLEPRVTTTSGRIWTNQMWNPSTLIPIYKTFDNQINRYFLENNVVSRAPKLVNVMDN